MSDDDTITLTDAVASTPGIGAKSILDAISDGTVRGEKVLGQWRISRASLIGVLEGPSRKVITENCEPATEIENSEAPRVVILKRRRLRWVRSKVESFQTQGGAREYARMVAGLK